MSFLDELRKGRAQEEASLRRARVGQGSGRKVMRDIMPPVAEGEPHTRHIPPPSRARRTSEQPVRKKTRFAEQPVHARPPAPPQEPAVALDRELMIRTWEPEGTRRSRFRKRIIVISAVVAAIGGFLIPTAVFPRFSVTIFPKVETVAVPRMELVAETTLDLPDPAKRRIPAISVTVERTATTEHEASGTKFIRDRAKGTVLLFNAFSSAPQTLVASTRLQDPSGKVFRLVRAVTIPGAQIRDAEIVPTSVSAEAIADTPGETYNIGPTEFRIPGFRGSPKYQGFYAKSEQPFSGGFEGEAKIVLAEDLRAASEDLTRRVVEETQAELQGKIPADPDFLAPDGSREVSVTEVIQPKPGERYDRFPTTVSARGRLIAIRRSHLSETAAVHLLPEESTLPMRLPASQPELTIETVRVGPGSTVTLALGGRLGYWQETNLKELTDTLRRSTPGKAEAYLRGRGEIEAFRIKRFPSWLWFVPERAQGLTIEIETPR